jgi:hypothetical protein
MHSLAPKRAAAHHSDTPRRSSHSPSNTSRHAESSGVMTSEGILIRARAVGLAIDGLPIYGADAEQQQ